jgi:hypothetical protein
MMTGTPEHCARHEKLRDRPFDFYVAVLVIFMGSYSFFDPDFPESLPTPMKWLIIVEDIYLVGSGLALIAALLMKHYNRRIVNAFEIEMFAWAFVSAAAAVIALTSPWVPPTAFEVDGSSLLLAWDMLWVGLSIAAASRSYYIRSHILVRVER